MNTTPSTLTRLQARTLADYPFQLTYQTRWADNDQYGHINNAVYNQLIDSIVNTYLIQHCGLSPTPTSAPTSTSTSSPPSAPGPAPSPAPAQREKIGLVVSSYAYFFAPSAFPQILRLGLRVVRIGSSSVLYEVGVFDAGEQAGAVKVVGGFTHVFVDREEARAGQGAGGGKGRGGRRKGGRGRGKRGMGDEMRRGLERILVREEVAEAAEVRGGPTAGEGKGREAKL